ncbi:hypothetical protein KSF78_0004577 [Schistosoma japonicum]|nr:hypothetical protein KSF78_0004577 [Schistosoma japonicum]
MIIVFCGLRILYVVSSMRISLGAYILGVSVSIDLKYDSAQLEIINGYITFYPNYAFSAFILFVLFAFIYSDTANVFYSFFPSNLTNVSTFHTQINTVSLV